MIRLAGRKKASPPLVAGSISAVAGDGQVVVSLVTQPSGGKGSITSTLYRHTSSFTPPGTGTSLGSVASPVTDTGRVNNTQYFYRALHQDSSGHTALSAVVSATPVSAANPYPNQPAGMTILLDDDMSSSYVSGPKGQLISNAASAGQQSPPSSQRANWNAGDGYPGAAESTNYGDIYKDWTLAPHQDYYLSLWFKFSSAYQFHDSGTKVFPWLGLEGEAQQNQSIFLKAHDSQPEHGPYGVALVNQGEVGRTMPPEGSSYTAFTKGAWLQVEILVHGNSAGVADGTAKVWVNNVLVVSDSGFKWRTSALARFTGVRIDPYWGGQGDTKLAADWIELDHFYVSGKN